MKYNEKRGFFPSKILVARSTGSVVVLARGELYFFDKAGKFIRSTYASEREGNGIRDFASSADGKVIATCHVRGEVGVITEVVAEEKIIGSFSVQSGCESIAISDSGKMIVAGAGARINIVGVKDEKDEGRIVVINERAGKRKCIGDIKDTASIYRLTMVDTERVIWENGNKLHIVNFLNGKSETRDTAGVFAVNSGGTIAFSDPQNIIRFEKFVGRSNHE
jgi:hypothetical protein